jgi:hypothetical protein
MSTLLAGMGSLTGLHDTYCYPTCTFSGLPAGPSFYCMKIHSDDIQFLDKYSKLILTKGCWSSVFWHFSCGHLYKMKKLQAQIPNRLCPKPQKLKLKILFCCYDRYILNLGKSKASHSPQKACQMFKILFIFTIIVCHCH